MSDLGGWDPIDVMLIMLEPRGLPLTSVIEPNRHSTSDVKIVKLGNMLMLSTS